MLSGTKILSHLFLKFPSEPYRGSPMRLSWCLCWELGPGHLPCAGGAMAAWTFSSHLPTCADSVGHFWTVLSLLSIRPPIHPSVCLHHKLQHSIFLITSAVLHSPDVEVALPSGYRGGKCGRCV